MKIYLIRHGESTWDLEERYGGAYDDYLTEVGELQAIELGRTLQSKHISCIYHSPKIRAIETTNILTQIIAAETVLIHDLQERNAYGILTGMIKSEAEERYPEEVEKIKKNKLYHDVKGSEAYDLFKTRILRAFDQILSDDTHESIAIVTHGWCIGCFLREMILREPTHIWDCAIIELEKIDDTLRVISLYNVWMENMER